MTRVLIVDDHPSIRAGLLRLMAAEPDLEVCGLAESGEAGLVLAVTLDPDVVVMDLTMPGMGGLAATRAILESSPDCRVLVLSWRWTEESVRELMGAGARGYVHKSGPASALVESIRAVARGERPLERGTRT